MGKLAKAVDRRLTIAREDIGLYRSWRDARAYYPRTVELLITGPCNARCSFCNVAHPLQAWRRGEAKKELSLDQYIRLFDEISGLGTKLLFINGGEPYLRKDIIQIYREAKKRRLEILVATNGGVLSSKLAVETVESGADTVAFSIDAPLAHVHDELRGVPGLWEKAVAGMARLNEARRERGSKMAITVWYVVSRKTIGLIGEMLEAKETLGYDEIGFQPMIAKTPRAQDLLCTTKDIKLFQDQIPKLANVAEAVGLGRDTIDNLSKFFLNPSEASHGRYSSDINKTTLCFSPWLVANIDPYGLVYTCCYANTFQNLGEDGSAPHWGNEEFPLGDLTKQSFRDIWNGPEYEKLRRSFQRPPCLPFCHGCGYQVHARETNARRTELFTGGGFWPKAVAAASRAISKDMARLLRGPGGRESQPSHSAHDG